MHIQSPTVDPVIDPKPRLMPVVGDSMEPTLRDGDFVVVVPVSKFRCDGLYVFDFIGAPDVYRASADFSGGIRIYKDNKQYGAYTLTPEQFQDSVLGQVFATCNVVDCTLLKVGRDTVRGALN